MTCRRSNTSRQKSRARFQRLKEAHKMKVRQLEEDLTKAKEEKEDLQEKFESLLEMGTHKNLQRTIEGLEEEICSLLEYNMNLKSSKGHAKAVYKEAKEVLGFLNNVI
uniref:Uncharacterized protein n=1 Tax=Rhizophagus irregularis (strain DAOM 181602 / DAOM 197198 / MUCL 43194) TaxID=747089 RepID=U9UG99_RHIID